MKYQFLPHTADLKFKAFGKTLNQAFESAAKAVSHILSGENEIKERKTKNIHIQGTDKKNLLYNFIEEIIHLLDADNFITAKTKVKITKNTLKAKLKGDNAKKYKGLDHIKSPTYAEMHIKKIKDNYEIQMVVDV